MIEKAMASELKQVLQRDQQVGLHVMFDIQSSLIFWYIEFLNLGTGKMHQK